jgi:hypothetical protein
MKCVLIFESIHQVMKAERILKEKGFSIDLIPVPRQISSDCGVAIELPWEDKEKVELKLEEGHISFLGCYSRDPDGRFKKEG